MNSFAFISLLCGTLINSNASIAPQLPVVLKSNTKAKILTLAFHPTEPVLAFGDDDGIVRAFAYDKYKALFETRVCEGGPAWRVAFIDNGNKLLAIADYEDIVVINVGTGKVESKERLKGIGLGLATSRDGKIAAIVGKVGFIKVWNTGSNKELLFNPPDKSHDDWLADACLTNDNKLLAASNRLEKKSIEIWDIQTQKKVKELVGHSSKVYGVATSPADKDLLASSELGGVVMLWDLKKGEKIWESQKYKTTFNKLAFSDDGAWLAVGTGFGEVIVWNVKSKMEVGRYQTDKIIITSVRFEPRSKRIAVAGEMGTLIMIDFEKTHELRGGADGSK